MAYINKPAMIGRAEFELAKQSCDDPVEAARRFLVRCRMSFGGIGEDWCYSVQTSRKGTAAAIRRWRWGIESLPAIHNRLKNVQIECADWRGVLRRFDGPNTLFFLDPPYVPQTRVAGEYAHETYEPLERAGWARIDYPTCTHVSGSLTRRVECLWLSPSVVRNGRTRSLFLSPTERMSQGAHHAHKVMVAATSRKLLRAIEHLRAEGKKPTATRLARATKMSREHVARKYRHLFAAPRV
jgi:DNA adenine methylase